MSETNFTPGPWFQAHRERSDGMWATEVFDDAGKEIATIAWHAVVTPQRFSTDRSANAHLIAAAPELYEALDMLMAATGPGDSAQLLAEERENIIELLAKARGEA